MGNPLEKRLRTVKRDWDELRRQNNALIELNNTLTRERDRLREALLLLFNAASADALAGAAPDYPAPGARFGSIVVLRAAGYRRSPSGQRKRLVHVRCDCGAVYDMVAWNLVHGRQRQCRSCGHVAAEVAQSTKLPSGKTISEIARETGVKADTVAQRWRRGWPEEDLALPPDRKARAARPAPLRRAARTVDAHRDGAAALRGS